MINRAACCATCALAQSEAAWKNHEGSKKHKKAVAKLRKELENEDALFGVGDSGGGGGGGGGDHGGGGGGGGGGGKKKKNKKKNKKEREAQRRREEAEAAAAAAAAAAADEEGGVSGEFHYSYEDEDEDGFNSADVDIYA